jgi:hypothetical protein
MEEEAELIAFHRTLVDSDGTSHTNGEFPEVQRMISETMDRQSRIKMKASESDGSCFFIGWRLTK